MRFPPWVRRLLDLGIGRIAVSSLARLETGPKVAICPRCGCQLGLKKWSRACPDCRFELGFVR